MMKIIAFSIDKISILTKRRFCQEIQYRHYNHFHLPNNLSVEYQIPGNCLVLIFNFQTKPSNYDIEIVWRLAEEEFHLRKNYMKIKSWSEKVTCKREIGRVPLTF